MKALVSAGCRVGCSFYSVLLIGDRGTYCADRFFVSETVWHFCFLLDYFCYRVGGSRSHDLNIFLAHNGGGLSFGLHEMRIDRFYYDTIVSNFCHTYDVHSYYNTTIVTKKKGVY